MKAAMQEMKEQGLKSIFPTLMPFIYPHQQLDRQGKMIFLDPPITCHRPAKYHKVTSVKAWCNKSVTWTYCCFVTHGRLRVLRTTYRKKDMKVRVGFLRKRISAVSEEHERR